MAKIFLSYRRQDSPAMAGRIYDRLRAHFGSDAVFMDIDSIAFGEDFRERIDAEVSKCDVFLAVIGTRWAGETDAHRRIDDPRDFVRIELESALHRSLPVIPILVDHVRMPGEADLPPSLTRLAFRNAIDVDQGRDFHHHVDLLIKGIEFHLQQLKIPAARPLDQAHEAAPTLAAAQEPARPRNVSPTEAAQPSKPTPTAEPRPDSPPRTSDTGQESKNEPKDAEGVKPAAQAIPAEVIEAARPPGPAPAHTIQDKPAVSTQLHGGAPAPTPPPTPWGSKWNNSIGMQLVRIEPGEFLMGSTNEQIEKLVNHTPGARRQWFDDEQPQHPVKITKPYYLAAHQVTVAQFRRFVENSGYKTETERWGSYGWDRKKGMWKHEDGRNWRDPGFAQQSDHPVVCVNHNDALAFLGWLNVQFKEKGRGYRLPTEAEWEYACRAGKLGLYGRDDDPKSLLRAANFDNAPLKELSPKSLFLLWKHGFPYTAPVGSFEGNAWDLYDMIGNVSEWCDDWYDPKFYQSSPKEDPRNTAEADERTVRGFSWQSTQIYCRPASRQKRRPVFGFSDLGFRVAAVQE